MNILVIGGGGREHALAWKAAQSELAETVYVAPGNAGTAREPKMENVDIAADDTDELVRFALREEIGLTIVGPEAPLVTGLVNSFQAAGLKCFGPSRRAAQLEGSKSFTKDFLARNDIPTADYQAFTDPDQAVAYVQQQQSGPWKGRPIVIKADGLAAGKGVVLTTDLEEAETSIRNMLAGKSFGKAGSRVVIEEFLDGEEASFIVMADGKHVLPMATSQDHKRLGDGDTGPNTGGMGAYSPAPVVDEQVSERIMSLIIEPTLQGMANDGRPYTGFLYAGLMIVADGEGGLMPKVIEYNCRFGDPETQPIMLRMRSDLVAHCLAAIDGKLDQEQADWDPRPSLGVVMAAGGYPEKYAKGEPIVGLPEHEEPCGKVFHAGTAELGDEVVTNGGRVLCATALGNSVGEAQQNAYALVDRISWKDMFCRHDIGYRAIERERQG